MGDPIAIGSDTKLSKFVYLTDDGTAFLTVLAERGNVSGVRLWSVSIAPGKTRDPFGIALGEDAGKLLAKRGKPTRTAGDIDGPFDAYQNGDTLWVYHIRGNQSVSSITLSTTEAAIEDLPERPIPATHGGTSAADAIRIVQPTGADVNRWETMYLAVHPCNGTGTWHIEKLDHASAVDAVAASCSGSGERRVFYFAPMLQK